MKPNHTPVSHNVDFKDFMTQVDCAKYFFDIHLPENIKVFCDSNMLTLTNSSFIDKEPRSRLSDVLYSMQTTEGERDIYFLVHNQSIGR